VRYGYFDDEAREYVITRPDTPLPWINYLGSEAFFGIVSNTAGGYSFYRDARLRRLTRCRYNNAPLDFGGRYVYLRDDESGEYWSPSWQPTQRDLEDYSCRHGLGYSIIASGYKGIRAETLYFVPLGENLEVWRIRVTNERPAPARLSLFSSIEWCLWDANDDSTNFQRNYSIGQVEVVDGVIYHKSEYRERRDHFAFFACSAPLAGFDTQRDAFLGPYRGWDRPIVVEQGRATDSIAHGWQPMGSHHVRLDLAPGETREVIVLLGYQENAKNDKFDPPGSQTINKKLVKPIIAHYLQSAVVDEAFEDLRDEWTRQLDILQVQTGNEHIDRMVNIWNPYQCLVTFNISRSASLFESGIGRGMGFRDSNQDLLGFVHMISARARERILDIAATQLPTGGAYHQYQPLTKRGNNDIGGGFNDDPAWLVIATAAYLRETGDLSILDEPVPFDNQAGSEAPLWQHLRRSIDYTLERVGPHGLPLIGRADWNDCLNLNCFSETPGETFQTTSNKEDGVAESVLIGGIFVLAANELAGVAELRGDTPEARRLTEAAVAMTKVVETAGWDGDWFRRAYDYFGTAVGSKECDEGQIFIEPQGMCVLAGIGLDNGMAGKALASVRERLATPDGILLHQPAYTYYHLELGEISSFPEGYKENSSVFCHTNPWVMIAEARMGNGEGALDYYLRINPSVREAISEVHRCEPFVYAQMISGRDAPVQGEAKNSWLTGTAAWNFVAISQWILGIRAEHDGLRIDPVLPADWEGFTATRRFRGATYSIVVHKAKGVTGRVSRLTIDGRQIAGSLVPLPAGPGQSFRIEAFVEQVPGSVTEDAARSARLEAVEKMK
jgi:cellobiose phosphorylase